MTVQKTYVVACVILLMLLFSGCVFADVLGDSSGTGKDLGPGSKLIDISDWSDLDKIGKDKDYPRHGNYRLVRDLLVPKGSYVVIEPIGTPIKPFTGTFDGNGKKIFGIMIDETGDRDSAGLFGTIEAETKETVAVKDLTLENPSIGGNVEYTGTLVGQLRQGIVKNITVRGSEADRVVVIQARGRNPAVGGIAGIVWAEGQLLSSSSAISVSGSKHTVGGLVGINFGIVSGGASGSVEGSYNVGGLIGLNASGSIASGSASGDVLGRNNVGGLVGGNSGVLHGFATGNVKGQSSTSKGIGGLVGSNTQGSNEGAVVVGYATGLVYGNHHVGGLVGEHTGGSVSGYALGYVIPIGTNPSPKFYSPSIGMYWNAGKSTVYIGRTEAEQTRETEMAGSGDHVRGRNTGYAQAQSIVEGNKENRANMLYSQNKQSFEKSASATVPGFIFGPKDWQWKMDSRKKWPILRIPAGFPGADNQNPHIQNPDVHIFTE